MTKYLIAIVAAASLLLAGCSQKSHVEKTSQEFNALPSAVQKAVRAQSPNAEVASVDRKTRAGVNYYVIDLKEGDRTRKITVGENGMLMENDRERGMGSSSPDSGITSGRWTESSRTNSVLGAPNGTTGRAASIDLSALPEAVQKTLKSKAANATIKNIRRHDENGRLIYEFEFEDEGKNPTMRVAEDGTVVQTLKK